MKKPAKAVKAVKAWMIVCVRSGPPRCAISGRLYLYLSKKDARADKFFDERIVRVTIAESGRKRR